MAPELCLVRGAGDLATGVIWRFAKAGWPVVACELAEPLTVRRTVAFSSAVGDSQTEVEGVVARRCGSVEEALAVSASGDVAVLVSPELPTLGATVVVDARLAKRNIDTTVNDADLVIGLGPGFVAGDDVHAVVETKRGHRLGRVLWSGSAAPNTGTPGLIDGKGVERVLRSPAVGSVSWSVAIGDVVMDGAVLGSVADQQLHAAFDGVVRGLIDDGTAVPRGMKIGDLDPRCDPSACWEISDKALAVGGGAVEAVLTYLARRG